MNRRDLLLLSGGALLASALPASASAARLLQGPAFGSSWKLVAGIDGETAARLTADIEAIIASVDGGMSPFRADSELSCFNRAPDTDWQPMSAETCGVVAEGLRVAAMTGDAFNPTVGPLVGRYGFGPIIAGAAGLPSEIAVRDGAIRKQRPALSLDLCGIAKGHALDRMAKAARAAGARDFLIELGGEVFAQGNHPSGRRWRVAVEAPASTGAQARHAVELDGVALATSGNAVNGYDHGGRRYSHIIDPITRKPADTRLFSVTVAAGTAMTADALATALYAMGPERGQAFAHRQGIEALFVMDDGNGVVTGGFDARMLGQEP